MAKVIFVTVVVGYKSHGVVRGEVFRMRVDEFYERMRRFIKE
jgi:hypothetical protein